MDHATGWLFDQYVTGWNADACGYMASGLVLATFSMKSMRPLRITAIVSNIAFIIYALTMHLQPIFLLHCILLPLNVFRLGQLELARVTGPRSMVVAAITHGDTPIASMTGEVARPKSARVFTTVTAGGMAYHNKLNRGT